MQMLNCFLSFYYLQFPSAMAWNDDAAKIPDGWEVKMDGGGRCPVFQDCGEEFPPARCNILGLTNRNHPCKR